MKTARWTEFGKIEICLGGLSLDAAIVTLETDDWCYRNIEILDGSVENLVRKTHKEV